MQKGENKADTMKRVGAYVGERLAGANKQESALVAGYSEQTAKTPSLIENTKAYALTVTRVLASAGANMDKAQEFLRLELEKDTPNPVIAQQWAILAQTQAKTMDILTPKVTVKETKDANGNVTRTSWGTGSLQTSEN